MIVIILALRVAATSIFAREAFGTVIITAACTAADGKVFTPRVAGQVQVSAIFGAATASVDRLAVITAKPTGTMAAPGQQCSSRAVRSQLRSTDQLGSRCIGPMPAAAAQSAATLCMWRTIVRTRSCSLLWFVKIAHTDQKLCCRRLHTSRHSCPEFLRGSCRCSHRSTLRQLQRPLLRMPRGCTG